MKKVRVCNLISALLSIGLLISTFICVAAFFRFGGKGNMSGIGYTAFKYFTTDSNILAALFCAFAIPARIRGAVHGNSGEKEYISILRLIGTSAITVTLLVVLFFLGPLFGYGAMFTDGNLFLHLLNPLMALGAFLLPCCGEKLSRRKALWGLFPVFVYGSVYLCMVIFLKLWNDFYGFNIGGRWYIAYPVMMLFAAALSLGLNSLRNRIITKSNQNR